MLRDGANECALKGEGARGAHCILVVHVSAQGVLWVDVLGLLGALVLVQIQEALFTRQLSRRSDPMCSCRMGSAFEAIEHCLPRTTLQRVGRYPLLLGVHRNASRVAHQ